MSIASEHHCKLLQSISILSASARLFSKSEIFKTETDSKINLFIGEGIWDIPINTGFYTSLSIRKKF